MKRTMMGVFSDSYVLGLTRLSGLTLIGCGVCSGLGLSASARATSDASATLRSNAGAAESAPKAPSSRLESLLALGDGLVSVRLDDREKARNVVPLNLDVHLVRPAVQGRPMAVIGSDKDRVWVVEVENKFAQASSLGPRVVPDDRARAAIEKVVGGGQVVFAYSVRKEPPGAMEKLVAGPGTYDVLVRSSEALYQVRMDGAEHPAVRRIGALRK